MNPDEQKKEETKKDSSTNKTNEGNQPQAKANTQLMRKIVIEFNSNSFSIIEANVASNFELQAVLESVLKKIAVQ